MKLNKARCLSQPGWFMPGEAEKAAKHLGLTLKMFFVKYLCVYVWRKGADIDHDVFILAPAMIEIKDSFECFSPRTGTCIFYENGHCGIDETRPFECINSNQRHVHELHLAFALSWDTQKNQDQIFYLIGRKLNSID